MRDRTRNQANFTNGIDFRYWYRLPSIRAATVRERFFSAVVEEPLADTRGSVQTIPVPDFQVSARSVKVPAERKGESFPRQAEELAGSHLPTLVVETRQGPCKSEALQPA